MTHDVIKNWDREPRESILSRIGDRVTHTASLKERLTTAIYRLRIQENRLEGASLRMQQHDKDVFEKCVRAQMAKDNARATMYANECAEIRKMAKATLQCQLALEQVTLRLETVREFGEIASMMGPVASVVRSLRNQIAGIIPEVGFELGEVSEMLNSVAIEFGEATGQPYDISTSSEEAQRILNEAAAIAEQKMRERFPDLPAVAAQPSKDSATRIHLGS
jgi:division protein CdvB (Snf7/Vps24/ESCRT-III family)